MGDHSLAEAAARPNDDNESSKSTDLASTLLSSTRLPDKIMGILLKNESPEAMWWLPGGTSFGVQKERFEGDPFLMNLFRGNKFKSLMRNLHRW